MPWGRQAAARKAAVERLYAGIIRQALDPAAYAEGLAEDSFDGRSGMVGLHATLVVWRLGLADTPESRKLQSLLHERVMSGFDASFRETGVGDSSIARKVRALGEAYYGLGTAVVAVLQGPEADWVEGLAPILVRNGITLPSHAAPAAARIGRLAAGLRDMADGSVLDLGLVPAQ